MIRENNRCALRVYSLFLIVCHAEESIKQADRVFSIADTEKHISGERLSCKIAVLRFFDSAADAPRTPIEMHPVQISSWIWYQCEKNNAILRNNHHFSQLSVSFRHVIICSLVR